MDSMRDTTCKGCHKWTHRLTPGGNGVIFCDQYCAYRYDLLNSTKYAFERYHYIPIGNLLWFRTDNLEDAWASLKHWLTFGYDRPTMEHVQHNYIRTESTIDTMDCIIFRRIH